MNLSKSAKSWQRQTVISSKGHELGLRANRRNRLVSAQLLESLRHLLAGNVVVHGSDGDITTVDNLGPVAVRVDVCARVESAERRLS